MFEGVERLTYSEDWITVILMFVLVLIAVLNIFYNRRFNKLFSLLYSEKYYTEYLKNKPLLFNPYHLIFFIIININISLLIYFTFKAFFPFEISNDLVFFLQIITIVIFYIILRYLAGNFIGFIFDISSEQNYISFLKISNLSLISILSFPLLILVNFSDYSYHRFWLVLSIILILMFMIIRYFTLLKNLKIDFSTLFYLFLYLCALEIAPIIVVYKTFVE